MCLVHAPGKVFSVPGIRARIEKSETHWHLPHVDSWNHRKTLAARARWWSPIWPLTQSGAHIKAVPHAFDSENSAPRHSTGLSAKPKQQCWCEICNCLETFYLFSEITIQELFLAWKFGLFSLPSTGCPSQEQFRLNEGLTLASVLQPQAVAQTVWLFSP